MHAKNHCARLLNRISLMNLILCKEANSLMLTPRAQQVSFYDPENKIGNKIGTATNGADLGKIKEKTSMCRFF